MSEPDADLGLVPEGSIDEGVSSDTVAEETLQTSEPEAKQDQQTAEEATDTAAETVAAEAFEFGGKSWTSRDEAEHAFKSWEGRIKAEQTKVNDLNTRINEYWEYVQAVSKENEQLRQTPATQKEKEEEPSPAVDWEQIQRLAKMAEKQGIDPVSVIMQTYAKQAEGVYEHKLNERLKALEEPISQMKEKELRSHADRELFMWAQGQNDNGVPWYPELQPDAVDEKFVGTVFSAWRQLENKHGAQFAYSPAGIDYAIRIAKEIMPPKVEKPRDDQGRFTAQNQAAVAASELTGSSNPMTAKRKSRADEVLDDLGAHSTVKVDGFDLGFYE